MRIRRRLTVSAALLLVSLGTRATFASESEEGASIALLAGYGVSTAENVLGFGGGFRAGYRLNFGLYLGGLALAHLGSSDPGEPDVRHHAQSARAELGYEFRLPELRVRPTLRAGAALVTTARDVNDGFVSPDVGVGLTLLVPIQSAFVGLDGDARFFTRLVDNGDNAYSIAALAVYITAGRQF